MGAYFHHKSTRRMSVRIEGGFLVVRFNDNGQTEYFPMPKDRTDKDGIRATRGAACAWAKKNGATVDQEAAIKKELTDNGYYLVGPQSRGKVQRVIVRRSIKPHDDTATGAYA
jgi:hypothetical protein